jgi:hypothetical protein
MFTGATVVVVGFFAILAGVTLQRFRQSLQDRRDLQARLQRNGRRVVREVLWTAGTLLVIYVAYKAIERGGIH